MKIKTIEPNWPAKKNVKALTTEKGRFSENNFSTYSSRDKDSVFHNRERLSIQLDLPSEPIWLNQTHSSLILDLDNFSSNDIKFDGLFTKNKKNVCAILTADCLPILISSLVEDKICALHAGWRGLSNGIIQNAISLMDSNPKDIVVWLGPGISQTAYEVSNEVYETFDDYDFSVKANFKAIRKNSWHLDLYGIARTIFNNYQIYSVYGGNFCTFMQKDRFFSYRRGDISERIATLLWLE